MAISIADIEVLLNQPNATRAARALYEGLNSTIKDLTAEKNALKARAEELAAEVEKLKRQAEQNSSNSHKPPSSDSPRARKQRRKKKPTGRKRGGQTGHKGHSRQRLPAEMMAKIIDVFADICEWCQSSPGAVVSKAPYIHQTVDLDENGGRYYTEYRCHGGECGNCGNEVAVPRQKVPRFVFGPQLNALVGALVGDYGLSRRHVPRYLKAVYGIDISLGTVSNIEGRLTNALEAADQEALAHVEDAAVKHVDETGWLRDLAHCSAWVFATAMASVFRVLKDGKRTSLRKALKKTRGILISDRATVFLYWAMDKRQICWAHLLRRFVDFSQRDGPVGRIGKSLVKAAELVFHYWQEFTLKTLSQESFEKNIDAVKKVVRENLNRAMALGVAEVSGSCADILKHWDAMWTFVAEPGVAPTNNHAERELRWLVMWRKRCHGSQSDRGERFVERIMTVTHTLRKRNRCVLGFIARSYKAMLEGTTPPKLLA